MAISVSRSLLVVSRMASAGWPRTIRHSVGETRKDFGDILQVTCAIFFLSSDDGVQVVNFIHCQMGSHRANIDDRHQLHQGLESGCKGLGVG